MLRSKWWYKFHEKFLYYWLSSSDTTLFVLNFLVLSTWPSYLPTPVPNIFSFIGNPSSRACALKIMINIDKSSYFIFKHKSASFINKQCHLQNTWLNLSYLMRKVLYSIRNDDIYHLKVRIISPKLHFQ